MHQSSVCWLKVQSLGLGTLGFVSFELGIFGVLEFWNVGCLEFWIFAFGTFGDLELWGVGVHVWTS